jgi:hypothetical protein
MVDINSLSTLNNATWLDIFSKVPGVTTIVTLGKAIGIAVLVYIIFLIIRSITQILYTRRFAKMTKNVEEINQKMDILISKLNPQKKKK